MSIVSRSTQQYSGFDPRTIPGCALWLDAADRNTISFSSGSTVSQWRDKSGNGRNFDVASGTPSYEPSLRFVRMSSSTIMKSMEAFTLPVNMSMFLVAQRATTAGADTIFMEHGPDINSADGFTYYTRNQYLYTLRRTVIYGVEDSATTQGSPVDILGQTMLHVVTYAHPQIAAFFLNGVSRSLRVTDNRIPTNTETTQRLYLNGRSNGTVISDVRWAEVILFTQTLTTAQRQQVEGYLAQKWNLSMPGISPATISQTPVFYPTSISNCALWLDAADRSSLSLDASGGVTTWRDKSGNSNVLTAINPSPYNETGIQITGSVAANAGNLTGFTNSTISVNMYNRTVFFVFTQTNNQYAQFIGFGPSNANIFGSNDRFRYAISPSTNQVDIYANNGNTLGIFSLSNVWGRQRNMFVDVGNNSAPNISFFANGTASGTGNYGGTAPTSVSAVGFQIARLPLSSTAIANEFFNGNIHEIIVYNTTLTTDQRTTVEQYLAQKWGLMPYYTTPAPALWLDAADTSTFDLSGTSVTTWRDKSGNSRNATQTLDSNKPILQSNSLLFLGSNSLNLPSGSLPSGSSEVSMFMVASVTNTANVQYFFGAGNPSNTQAFNIYTDTNTLNLDVFGTRARGSFTSTGSNILGYTFGSSTLTIFVNGTSNTSTGTVTKATGTGSNSIGASSGSSGGSQFFMTGRINEIIVYGSNLNSSQRQSVESYLANKWGISTATNTIVPQLALWLDAADRSTITTSGTSVTQWRDKSGNARHATNTGTGIVYGSTFLNGLNTMNFASGSILTTPSMTLDPITRTAFIVYRFTSNVYPTDANFYTNLFLAGTGATNPFQFGQFRYNASPYLWVPYFSAGGSAPEATGSFNSSASGPTNQPIMITIQRSAASTGLINYFGAATTTKFNVTNNFNTTESLVIGSNLSNHQIGELILFNSALSTFQIQLVEGYLAAKWGLRTSLPSTHPYHQPFALPVAHPYRSLAPAVRPFLPIDIDGLALWLDAADSSTLSFSSGSNVSQWRDKATGVIAQYITGIGSVNPPVSGSTINGVNALLFDRTLLPVTASLNTTNRTYFIVANLLNGYTNGTGAIFWATTVVNSYVRGATMTFESTRITLANQNVANLLFLNSSLNSNSIISATFNNGTTGMWNNGGGTTTATGQSSSAFGSNGSTDNSFVIGGTTGNMEPISSSTAGYFSRMLFGEMLIYNSSLTTAQRQQVEGYLAAKWGLSTSLPPAIQAVPSIFDPRTISGCALWLDGADVNGNGTIPADGASIATWTDKSGNGRNAIQNTSGNRPTYSTMSNGIVFSSASRQFLTQSGTSTYVLSNMSYFFVLQSYSVSNDNAGVFLLNTSTTNDFGSSNALVFLGGRTTDAYNVLATNNLSNLVITGSGSPVFSRSIITQITSNQVGSGFVNGSNSGNLTYGSMGTAQFYMIGNRSFPNGVVGSNSAQAFNGIFHEILLFSNALTTAQRQQVEGYLYTKWNIPLTRHPYYRIQSLPTTPIFTPASLSGLQLWLDAADTSTIGFSGSGSNVAQWSDKSGNGRNATQSTLANQPTFQNSIIFNGSQWLRGSWTYSGTNVLTLFVVFQMESSTAFAGRCMSFGATGQEDWISPAYFTFGNRFESSSKVGIYRGVWLVQQDPFAFGTMQVWSGVFTGSQFQLYINGNTPTTSSVSQATSNFGFNEFALGTGAGITNSPMNGRISEVIAYSSALTTSQRQAVEGYLAWKWGLRNNLPLNFNRTIQSPLAISGCSLWLDAADPAGTGVVPANGASVSTWVDKSQTQMNMTGTNVIYNSSLRALSFNGSSASMSNTTQAFLSNRTNWTIFAVHISAVTSSGIYQVYRTTGTALLYRYRYAGYPSEWHVGGNNYITCTENNGNGISCQITETSTTATGYLNGVRIGSANRVTSSGVEGLFIGQNSGNQEWFNGTLHEIIAYNRAISTSERQSVEAYLQTKWNVAVPTAHPYKNFRP